MKKEDWISLLRITGIDQNAITLANRIFSSEAESFLVSGPDAQLFYNKIIASSNGTFLISTYDTEFVVTLSAGKKDYEILMNIKRRNNYDLNICRVKNQDMSVFMSKTNDINIETAISNDMSISRNQIILE